MTSTIRMSLITLLLSAANGRLEVRPFDARQQRLVGDPTTIDFSVAGITPPSQVDVVLGWPALLKKASVQIAPVRVTCRPKRLIHFFTAIRVTAVHMNCTN